jgi:hypothetical protein
MAKHSLPSLARKSILTATLALLALASTRGRAFAQAEAAPAPVAPAAAPSDDNSKATPDGETAKSAPVEAPKCNCPPPCPAPPPPPPAPPVNPVEWKAQSKGGMLLTSGNSDSKNFTFGVNGFRKVGNNKLALEGGLAYGTSNATVARMDDPNNPNIITSLDHQQVVSTNNMAAKGRYDRFLTEHNTVYASGQAAADKVAGKTFFGGGQVGYSRLLVEDKWNLVVAELGYDFSYERYIQQAGQTADPVEIHSARVLVGETLSLSKETGVTASVEALFNLNTETKAINVNTNTGSTGVKAFKDTRVNAKVGLSTNLWKSLSFGFSFALKYDQNPAPRPIPKTAPAGASFNPTDSIAYSDKVDTLTEATFIYTFF